MQALHLIAQDANRFLKVIDLAPVSAL